MYEDHETSANSWERELKNDTHLHETLEILLCTNLRAYIFNYCNWQLCQ